MASSDNKTLWVVSAEPEPPAPLQRGAGLRPPVSAARAIDVSVLRDNLTQFLTILEQILPQQMTTLGDFRLEEVEVTAEVTGEGSLMLLGTGVRATGLGGIKFVLKRMQ
jgi:hypothetical protein